MPVSKGRKKAASLPARPGRSTVESTETPKPVALYHVVDKHEPFDDTADKLHQMLRRVAETNPGAPRYLYLDIEGHRNEAGGFDNDMLELQQNFILGFLSRWLTRISFPLSGGVIETQQQYEDIPPTLSIIEDIPVDQRDEILLAAVTRAGGNYAAYDADTGELVAQDGSRRAHYQPAEETD